MYLGQYSRNATWLHKRWVLDPELRVDLVIIFGDIIPRVDVPDSPPSCPFGDDEYICYVCNRRPMGKDDSTDGTPRSVEFLLSVPVVHRLLNDAPCDVILPLPHDNDLRDGLLELEVSASWDVSWPSVAVVAWVRHFVHIHDG
jgi:hypothetical protein